MSTDLVLSPLFFLLYDTCRFFFNLIFGGFFLERLLSVLSFSFYIVYLVLYYFHSFQWNFSVSLGKRKREEKEGNGMSCDEWIRKAGGWVVSISKRKKRRERVRIEREEGIEEES